ncbi:MAG: DNA-binding NtrC family response regulator [Myxococcota bacterium]|jgi:DNA-binding NtrC family response regulator
MAAPAALGEAEQYTVLVVEDEADHQLLIQKTLGGEGGPFSLVQFARNSEQARRFTQQMSFDVMLVDNRIPGARGLDLMSELREDGVDAPFVLMTSAGSEDLVVQAYRQNASDYVIKDGGFWKELPSVLRRVVVADRAKKREAALLEHLERTNAKLDAVQAVTRRQQGEIRAHVRALSTAVADLDGDVQTKLGPMLVDLETLLVP